MMMISNADVFLFHFWKAVTKGRHLWLRNNGSTLVSQMVDTTAVILITHFYAHALPVNSDEELWPQILVFISLESPDKSPNCSLGKNTFLLIEIDNIWHPISH